MFVQVRVIPKSSRVAVKMQGQVLKVCLTKPACDGLANRQLIEVLAGHFKIKKHQITITKGLTSKNKLISITDD